MLSDRDPVFVNNKQILEQIQWGLIQPYTENPRL